MPKRLFFNLLKYLLAFGLLAYVVSSNWAPASGKGLSYVWQRHAVEGKPVQWVYLLGAMSALSFALTLTHLRWFVLVRAQGLPFRVVDALRLGLLGYFFSTFLPGSVGGDIVKAATLARVQARRTVAVATVLMDRLIALWALVWFVALLGGAFWLTGALEGSAAGVAERIVRSAGLVVVVSGCLWLLLGLLPEWRAQRFAGQLSQIPKVGNSAAELWRAVWIYRWRQKSVALAMGMSWVGFVGFVFCFYCCAQVLWDGDPENPLPSLMHHFLLLPIGLVIIAIPLFPGGAGIGELGFGILYGWFGFEKANGIIGSLVQRALTWVLALTGYVVSLAMRPAPAELGTEEREEPDEPSSVEAIGPIEARPEPFTAS